MVSLHVSYLPHNKPTINQQTKERFSKSNKWSAKVTLTHSSSSIDCEKNTPLYHFLLRNVNEDSQINASLTGLVIKITTALNQKLVDRVLAHKSHSFASVLLRFYQTAALSDPIIQMHKLIIVYHRRIGKFRNYRSHESAVVMARSEHAFRNTLFFLSLYDRTEEEAAQGCTTFYQRNSRRKELNSDRCVALSIYSSPPQIRRTIYLFGCMFKLQSAALGLFFGARTARPMRRSTDLRCCPLGVQPVNNQGTAFAATVQSPPPASVWCQWLAGWLE